jgi:hypothetical protein
MYSHNKMSELYITFEFRDKQRQAKIRMIEENLFELQVSWDEDDLIWHFGKRFYVTDSHINLIGNQRPPPEAKELHEIVFEEILKHREYFSI